jgi:hypothetical protein
VDALKFGEWLARQRWSCGYPSQRALIDAVRQHPRLSASGISEAFLARLEAGVLAHPFRGLVRAKILALAQLLCATPRDLRLYLRHAELSDLGAYELEDVKRLDAYLSRASKPTPVILPARPARLLGRTAELEALLRLLQSLESGCCAITGMPGVGKSALAAEALRRLTADAYELASLFPDGLVTVSGTGRRGLPGLVAVFEDLSAAISPQATADAARAGRRPPMQRATLHATASSAADMATAINRTRLLLAGKSALVLLDDVGADFPLRLALDALVTQITPDATPRAAWPPAARGRCLVLVTSRYVPDSSILAAHLPLAPLEPEAALALFLALARITPSAAERRHGERICAALGYLPLAVEVAAAAVTQEQIPLAVLETRVRASPLGRDGTRELRAALAQTIASVGRSARERLALIAALRTDSITLDQAAALRTHSAQAAAHSPAGEQVPTALAPARAASAVQLARAAADVGHLVRHSLLSPIPPRVGTDDGPRYVIHPLVQAYVRTHLTPRPSKEMHEQSPRRTCDAAEYE